MCRILPAVLSIGLGLILIGVAVPRTYSAWMALEAAPALSKLQKGVPPSDRELEVAAISIRRANDWTPSARRLADLALVELNQALRLKRQTSERTDLLTAAEWHLEASLRINPADGFVWLRLAAIRQARAASERAVVLAFMQSLDMAPNQRPLWVPRAEMIFGYWRSLNPEELDAVCRQLRTIWRADADMRLPLVSAALRAGELDFAAQALAPDWEAQAEFASIRGRLIPKLKK